MINREIHDRLNQIFVFANETAGFLNQEKIDNQLQFIAGNYLKIEDSYELQAYPIPVILVKGKGEIGFNLDGIYFEFVMKKETASRVDVGAFEKDYKFEIYGVEDKDQSYYREGMSKDSYEAGLKKSKEKGFGIAFYFENGFESAEELYKTFSKSFMRIIKGA